MLPALQFQQNGRRLNVSMYFQAEMIQASNEETDC
jgi:hypothetical protein